MSDKLGSDAAEALTPESCGIRVIMRPPRKLERGWFVMSKTAEGALVEVVRNACGANPLKSADYGWVADRDYTNEVDANGMHAITVVRS